jgi:hypothetical protein
MSTNHTVKLTGPDANHARRIVTWGGTSSPVHATSGREATHRPHPARHIERIEQPPDRSDQRTLQMPFGDLIVLVIVILPVALPVALLRAEPLRVKGTDTPAVA